MHIHTAFWTLCTSLYNKYENMHVHWINPYIPTTSISSSQNTHLKNAPPHPRTCTPHTHQVYITPANQKSIDIIHLDNSDIYLRYIPLTCLSIYPKQPCVTSYHHTPYHHSSSTSSSSSSSSSSSPWTTDHSPWFRLLLLLGVFQLLVRHLILKF